MVIRSSASTHHIQLYLLVMNEAEKFEFISCGGIFIMHFLIGQILSSSQHQHLLLWCPHCRSVLHYFPIQPHHMQQPSISGRCWDNWWHQNWLHRSFYPIVLRLCLKSFTTSSRPKEYTNFYSQCQAIPVRSHSYMIDKESYVLGWCCRAHKAR